jgi:hypothetical protein
VNKHRTPEPGKSAKGKARRQKHDEASNDKPGSEKQPDENSNHRKRRGHEPL